MRRGYSIIFGIILLISLIGFGGIVKASCDNSGEQVAYCDGDLGHCTNLKTPTNMGECQNNPDCLDYLIGTYGIHCDSYSPYCEEEFIKRKCDESENSEGSPFSCETANCGNVYEDGNAFYQDCDCENTFRCKDLNENQCNYYSQYSEECYWFPLENFECNQFGDSSGCDSAYPQFYQDFGEKACIWNVGATYTCYYDGDSDNYGSYDDYVTYSTSDCDGVPHMISFEGSMIGYDCDDNDPSLTDNCSDYLCYVDEDQDGYALDFGEVYSFTTEYCDPSEYPNSDFTHYTYSENVASEEDCDDTNPSLTDNCGGSSTNFIDLYWTSDYQGNNKITTPQNLNIGDKIFMVMENISIQGEEAFEIYEKDIVGDDEIRTGYPTSGDAIIDKKESGNLVIVNWTITTADIDAAGNGPYKFYFKIINDVEDVLYNSKDNDYPNGILEASVTGTGPSPGPTPSEFCDSVTICSDLNETQCGECDVDSDPSGNCTGSSMYPQCNWTGSECISQCVYINSTTNETLGYCNYQSSTNGDCSNSQLLTYSWTAEWINADTQSSFTEPSCTGGERTIACPAQTKLPLTSLFGIILTIIIIGFGYVLFNKKK